MDTGTYPKIRNEILINVYKQTIRILDIDMEEWVVESGDLNIAVSSGDLIEAFERFAKRLKENQERNIKQWEKSQHPFQLLRFEK